MTVVGMNSPPSRCSVIGYPIDGLANTRMSRPIHSRNGAAVGLLLTGWNGPPEWLRAPKRPLGSSVLSSPPDGAGASHLSLGAAQNLPKTARIEVTQPRQIQGLRSL